MWSLRASDTSPFDTSLVQSFSRETRLLSIEGEELSEGFIPGFKTTEATLYCGNLIGNLIVQVTTSDIVVISRSLNETVFSYSSPSRITVAEGNMRQLVIATAGSELVYFEVGPEGAVALVSRSVLDNDIACMSMRAVPIVLSEGASAAGMPPAPPTLAAEDNVLHPMGRAGVLAVGMWTDGTARLLKLPSLAEVCRTSLGTDVQVRDLLLLHHIETPGAGAGAGALSGMSKMSFSSFLLAGMGDGCVVSYSLGIAAEQGPGEGDESSGHMGNCLTAEQYATLHSTARYSLHSRRRVVLGARPIAFSCFLVGGNNLCGFSTCDRPTVFYVRNGQLQFSMVNTGEAMSMTPFHSEMFPDCLALSSDSSLVVCNLDTIQKVHVEKVEMDEDPHHICYAPNLAIYGVLSSTVGSVAASGGSASEAEGQWGTHQVSFFNADLQKFNTHELEPLEHGLSIYCCNLYDDSKGDSCARAERREYIVVGTAFALPGESEPNRGRILVFKLERLAGGSAGKGASIAVDYDDIDDHAM
jgi:DNA damage-binding protein 1